MPLRVNGLAVMVTDADADLVGSAALVAVTVAEELALKFLFRRRPVKAWKRCSLRLTGLCTPTR